MCRCWRWTPRRDGADSASSGTVGFMTEQNYDVIIVGAGFGGIGAAVQPRCSGFENFVLLDRLDDLGGTWYVNHYPGLACAVPTTTYSYFFEPNPNWSRLFSPGAEIKRYADDVADKYDVRRHIRFNTKWRVPAGMTKPGCGGWQPGRWQHTELAVPDHRDRLPVPTAHPGYPGIHGFEGKVIHTTAWDDSLNPAGKRIGLIGTGATAVQLIPELAKTAGDLTVYQRTAIYVVPKIDFGYPERAKKFARVPLAQRAVRARSPTPFTSSSTTWCCTTGRRCSAGSTSARPTSPSCTATWWSVTPRCAAS